MSFLALLPAAAPDAADRAGEMAGLVARAGLAVAAGRFLVAGTGSPRLPLPAPSDLLRLAAPYAEPDAEAIADLARRAGTRLVLIPDDGAGRALAVRIALLLGAACLTAVTALAVDGDGWAVTRRSHAGRLNARHVVAGRPLVVTVARGLDAATVPLSEHRPETILDGGPLPDWLTDARFMPSAATAGLEQAERVLIAGRGAGSRAGVERLAAVAARLGMTFAVSRPVAMNAWAPLDRLAGVSGAMLKPRLCVLAGVSGAPALMAAVARSRTLVAINSDPEAPVFRQVDVGVVGDCLTTLETLAARTAPD